MRGVPSAATLNDNTVDAFSFLTCALQNHYERAIKWRKLCTLFGVDSMQTVGELSPASRDLALHRFRLLEPHLEHERPLRVIAEEAAIPFRTTFRSHSSPSHFELDSGVKSSRFSESENPEMLVRQFDFFTALRKDPT